MDCVLFLNQKRDFKGKFQWTFKKFDQINDKDKRQILSYPCIWPLENRRIYPRLPGSVSYHITSCHDGGRRGFMAPVQHRQREARRGLHHQLHRFSPGEEKTAEILSTQRLLFLWHVKEKSPAEIYCGRHVISFFWMILKRKDRGMMVIWKETKTGQGGVVKDGRIEKRVRS